VHAKSGSGQGRIPTSGDDWLAVINESPCFEPPIFTGGSQSQAIQGNVEVLHSLLERFQMPQEFQSTLWYDFSNSFDCGDNLKLCILEADIP
jgi:hypothetical protein